MRRHANQDRSSEVKSVLSVHRILSERQLKCCLLKYPKLCLKASWSFCSVLFSPSLTDCGCHCCFLGSSSGFTLKHINASFTQSCRPDEGTNQHPSCMHGVQAPRFQLCWSTTVGSLLRARRHFSLTCFIYHLLRKLRQLLRTSLCFTSHLWLGGDCYFQYVLLIGKKMQPRRMDFMLLLQVAGILMSKIRHIRLIGDSKLLLTMKQNKSVRSVNLHFHSFLCPLFVHDFLFYFILISLLFMWKAFSHSLSSPSCNMNNSVK